MKPAITSIETAEETFSFDVSDEALEIAAQAKEKSKFTLGACTGLSVCPVDRLNCTQIGFRTTADGGAGRARSLITA